MQTKVITAKNIINALKAPIINCLIDVECQVSELLKDSLDKESNEHAKWALRQIIDNNDIARSTQSVACQDTGLAIIFVSVGRKALIDCNLTESINEAVSQAYSEGYCRKSVADPLTRINTKTNTPSIIHYDIVEGDQLTFKFLAKGAGSENMSALYMLTPSKGRQGIIDSVIDCVQRAGANPCPPIVIGVGIGGDASKCMVLSKLALTRATKVPSPDADLASLESEILTAVNALKIGAQGFGGDTTALSVHIEKFATHIGMLPVSVCIQCHCVRHTTVII